MAGQEKRTSANGSNPEAEDALAEWTYTLSFMPDYFARDESQLREWIALNKEQANISNPLLSAELTYHLLNAFAENDDSEDVLAGVRAITETIRLAEREIAGKTEDNLSIYEAGLKQHNFSANEIGWRLNSYRARARKFASLLKEDPSGFTLLETTLQDLESEGYIAKLQTEIPTLRPKFPELMILGAKSAVDTYKRFYHLCSPAGQVSQR